MGWLTAFALNNKMTFIAFAILIGVFGPVSFSSHPSREDPKITIRTANVTAQFPGMAPERVENLITKKIEEKVREIPEVKDIETTSRTGSATVKVILADKYFNVDEIWQDLRNKMDDLRPDLPDGTIGPAVDDDRGNVAMATVAMTAEGFDLAEMRDQARSLRDRLYSINGIRKIDLYGVETERVFLEFSNNRMAQLGISPNDLVTTLQNQNIVLPGGKIEAGSSSFVVEPSGNFGTIAEIGEVPIDLPNTTGQVVYLRDIGKITRRLVDPPKSPAFFNGKPAIVIGISMVDQFDALAFGKALESRLTSLENTLPIGYQLTFVTFQPNDISRALGGVTNNLYQTIAIVLAVVMVFLGIRTGLIVGSMVPLTMLLALLMMRLLGIDLERMSLASLIIALGLLVDNGIVIAEGIQTKIGDGIDRLEAAVSTGREMALPLLSSSLTTIFAFMPLMLAENAAGEYTRSLSLVIGITLLGSWLIALTITPLLCYWFIKPPERDKKAKPPSRLLNIYRGLLSAILRFRIAFLGIILASMVGAVMLFQFVPKVFFPASDRAQYQIYIDLPVGQNIYATLDNLKKLNVWLNNKEINPEIASTVSYAASGGPRFFLSLSPIDPDPHRAFILVNTTSSAQNNIAMERARRHIVENFPAIRAEIKALSLGPGEVGLVQYRIFGRDENVINDAAQTLEAKFQSIPGTLNIKNDWGNRSIKILVKIDQARARRAGVTSKAVADGLNAMLSGSTITDFREGDTIIPVIIRAQQSDRGNLDRLRTLNILTNDNKFVPLLQIADFAGVPQFSLIRRRNIERVVTVSARHRDKTAAELNKLMQPAVQSLNLGEGYRVELDGELSDSSEAQGALFANMPLALALIVLILVFQFDSYRKPLIILAVIPLTIIGVALGLLAAPGAVFGFMAIMGLLSLAGIVINNAIVLIDRIEQEQLEDKPLNDAIIDASLRRVRPIMMTTLTTAVGLAPIIINRDVLFYDLAVVVASGLLVATILTLGVVPVLYSLAFGGGKTATSSSK